MDYDVLGLVLRLIGACMGLVLILPFIAVIVNLCTYARKTPEQRARIFLYVMGVLMMWLLVRGFWFEALSFAAPTLIVWFLYRSIMQWSQKRKAAT